MQKSMVWAEADNSAASRRRPGVVAFAALALALSSILSGCNSLYSEGAVTGKVTSNAAVATGIGLGAVAAARADVQYSERVIHRNTQDGIAKIAGPLDVGAVAPWSVTHSVPLEDDEHGRVTMSRTISAGALDCKEIVFSVDHIATQNVPRQAARST